MSLYSNLWGPVKSKALLYPPFYTSMPATYNSLTVCTPPSARWVINILNHFPGSYRFSNTFKNTLKTAFLSLLILILAYTAGEIWSEKCVNGTLKQQCWFGGNFKDTTNCPLQLRHICDLQDRHHFRYDQDKQGQSPRKQQQALFPVPLSADMSTAECPQHDSRSPRSWDAVHQQKLSRHPCIYSGF